MATENIFRFISVRPTKLERAKSRLNLHVYSKDTLTPFYNELAKASAQGASREQLAAIALRFQQTKDYVTSIRELKFPLEKILDWITDNGRATFGEGKFVESIEGIIGKKLPEATREKDFTEAYNNLRDSVLANILSATPVEEKEEKISSIKVLYTLLAFVQNKSIDLGEEIINDYFGRSTVVFPFMKAAAIKQEPPTPVPGTTPPVNDRQKEQEARRARLANFEKAHRELSNLVLNDNNRAVTEDDQTGDNDRIRSIETRLEMLSGKCVDEKDLKRITIEGNAAGRAHKSSAQFILSEKATTSLSNETKMVLKDMNIDTAKMNIEGTVQTIEKEINYLQTGLDSTINYTKMVPFRGGYIDQTKFQNAVLTSGGREGTAWSFLKKCSFKAGVGDLLIVRQKLKAYELAEFAHVENALAGETREREHRRLNLREEITTSETERETEKERNLQSTERNEMQNEAEKVVQQQAHVDAGLQVSGSYGPSISFTASLNAGFSSSVEETQKKSTSYSREVTEKSSEKIREKVREERRTRTLEQIEEINKHSINNSDAANGHIRGIYRWLNKIYDAQIFNYGQRMMYEFVLPEPAAFFLYATIENPPQDTELIKPEPPEYYGSPLKPGNLTRTNYQNYVSVYHVTNAPEPPSQFTVKTYFDKQDGNDNQNIGRSSAIALPEGYEAYAATVSSDYVYEEGASHSIRLMVGSTNYDRTPYWGAEYKTFSRRYRGEISVAVEYMKIRSFALSVDVFCTLTDEAFAKWQHKMYDAIMQAYFDQKATYDAKIEQKDIQKGIVIEGRNPIENRRIEKEELKKLIIMVLTQTNFLNINSYTSSAEPLMDLDKICKNGSYIRFFENAFEWHNILYVFYPYFWGRHAKWVNALHLTDPDLDFAAFLKAGAARVQIPVRPGFEKAIAYFCQTGIIWDGNDVPLIGDELYVPIIKEISENLGKLDEGVPYPADSTPWEVTVPTSLVLVQDLEEIPNIRDILTGNNIDIRNLNP